MADEQAPLPSLRTNEVRQATRLHGRFRLRARNVSRRSLTGPRRYRNLSTLIGFMTTATRESEEELILRAQNALSNCNWVIGECAAQWTQRYAKGRTDADFGDLIGLSGDQVYQRRRVWETYADVYGDYSNLKWSHFYVSLTWDDASECLQWANENEATVAEMKAWRRAQHGEDLSTPGSEQPPFDATGDYLMAETGMVRDPNDFAAGSYEGSRREYSGDGAERAPTAMAAARASEQEPYAPFGKGARGSAPAATEDKTPPTSEQTLKRICSTLEKVDAALTPEILQDFHTLPLQLQQRLLDLVDNLQSKTEGLR